MPVSRKSNPQKQERHKFLEMPDNNTVSLAIITQLRPKICYNNNMKHVFQPTAIVGNGQSLVTLGKNGEIMGCFYPNLDHAQNIKQGMVAIHSAGQLHWTYDSCFKTKQEYIGDTNILKTTATAVDIEVEITDFFLENEPIFIRKFHVKNISPMTKTGRLFQYLNVNVDDIAEKNSATYDRELKLITQNRRETTFAVTASDNLSGATLGKSGEHNSAYNTLQTGQLNNQKLEIGNVDAAFGFDYELHPDENACFTLYFSLAKDANSAVKGALNAKCQDYNTQLLEAKSASEEYLARARKIETDDPLINAVVKRSLLGLKLICDKVGGGILAAPEFDPDFLGCGGYGFMWPRDSAEVAILLSKVNLGDVAEKFFDFASKIQHGSGYFEQRYWLNGNKGPCWCEYPNWLQIDQVAAVIVALYEWSNKPNAKFVTMMERASEFLLSMRAENGLHKTAADCWEKFSGIFTYSNAAIYRAFLSASAWQEQLGNAEKATQLKTSAEKIKETILSTLYNGEYFARGISDSGEIDYCVDAAFFGLIEPFGLLDLDNENELKMAENMVKVTYERLLKELPEGMGVMRHEGDDYVDGSAGGVTTLWFARVLLRLAIHFREVDKEKSLKYFASGIEFLHVVAKRSEKVLYLLPELIGGGNTDYWAMAHGWAMAEFIECACLVAEGGGKK